MEKENLREFIHTIYNMSGQIHQLRNMEVTLNMEAKVNTAMLSTLDVINCNPDLKMSQISRKMGLTKGAISQMAQKIESRGLIEKSKSEFNSKDTYLIITEKGKQALQEYHELHDGFYNGIFDIISQYTNSEEQVICEFICKMNEFLAGYKENWIV